MSFNCRDVSKLQKFRAAPLLLWKNLCIKNLLDRKNPSRRFSSCAYPQGEICDFFQWLDPEMRARSLEVMPGLLRRLDKMEQELEIALDQRKKMQDLTERLKSKKQNVEAELVILRSRFSRVVLALVFLCIMYWFGCRCNRAPGNGEHNKKLSPKAIGHQ